MKLLVTLKAIAATTYDQKGVSMKSVNTNRAALKSTALSIALCAIVISFAAPYASAQTGWAVGTNGSVEYYDGTTWTTQALDTKNNSPLTDADLLAVHAGNDTTACAVGEVTKKGPFPNRGVILCTKDGKKWDFRDSKSPGINLRGVAFSTPTFVWAVGDSGTVLFSDNKGDTWNKVGLGKAATTATLYSVTFFIDKNHACIVGGPDPKNTKLTYIACLNKGKWQTASVTSGLNARSVSFVSNAGVTYGWIVGEGDFGAWWSPNGGQTWQQLLKNRKADLYAVKAVGKPIVWVAGAPPDALRTTDALTNAGTTWKDFPVSERVTVYGVAFTDAQHGWVAGSQTASGSVGVIYKTENGDQGKVTWTRDNAVNVRALYGIVMLPAKKQGVTLDPSTTPSSGSAGMNYLSVGAAGFADGNINPANVVVTVATGCNGPVSTTAPAASIVSGSGDSKLLSFLLPSGLDPGQYFVSISDYAKGDAYFESSNCSAVTVVR